MGNIKCIKCGAECWGKCPKCRSVFHENEEFQQSQIEAECDHVYEYIEPNQKCIYGCGYVSEEILW